MADNDLDSKLVLFLGAGFSWDARLPLMGDFGRGSVETQRAIETNAKRYRAGPAILKAKRTYLAFQELCAKSDLLTPDKWSNVEELFGVAEIMKHTGKDGVDLNGREMPIDEVIADLQTWIWKTYQQLPIKRGEKRLPVNRAPYEKLFRTLKDLRDSCPTTIITTNYDIIVEYSAYLENLPVRYPFKWNPSLGVTASRRHFVELPTATAAGPLLCKLHGSVNYFEWATGGVLVAADLGDGHEAVGGSPPRGFRDEPTIAMYDAIWKIQSEYSGAQPAIVPPSYAKLQTKTWLADTWQHAASALAKASTIAFVGYSLPRTDGFIRALLVSAKIARGRAGPQRIVVIDTSPDVRRDYRELYHSIEPRGTMDFATAMDSFLPGVLAEAASK